MCFSAPQNSKNKNQLEHKNHVSNLHYLECWVLEYERLYLILGVEHIKVKGVPQFQYKH